MKCWHCNSELIWQSDFSFENYEMNEEGVVTVLRCSGEKCNCITEVYKEIQHTI